MAKIVKSTREMVDVESEVQKLTKKTTMEDKKDNLKLRNSKSKSDAKKKKTKSNKGHFWHEIRKEVSKVKWPSKKDMVKYSIATIIFIIFFAVFFYLIELILALLKMGV